MQISLTGFLEKKTPAFMTELWRLLLSAQDSPVKVPAEFIEQKKEEMRKRQADSESALVRREGEVKAASRIDDVRQRERGERQQTRDSSGRGGFGSSDRGRGRGRGGSDFQQPSRDAGWGRGRNADAPPPPPPPGRPASAVPAGRNGHDDRVRNLCLHTICGRLMDPH